MATQGSADCAINGDRFSQIKICVNLRNLWTLLIRVLSASSAVNGGYAIRAALYLRLTVIIFSSPVWGWNRIGHLSLKTNVSPFSAKRDTFFQAKAESAALRPLAVCCACGFLPIFR
jgi:hypothetical protein